MIEPSELIDSSHISVVIQGLTHYVEGDENCLFYKCINSIKEYLPNAEIIVSTWKGQECDETVIDKVIFSSDPGAFSNKVGRVWNYNRMLVSTKVGIENSTRQYVLKFRSDIYLSGNNFFLKKEILKKDEGKYLINKNKIIITNLFIRKPDSYAHLLFHLSDIVQFGLKSDLYNLWCGNLYKKEDVIHELKWKYTFNYLGYSGERIVPEQALMIDWLGRAGISFFLPYATFVNKQYLKDSELFLNKNFYIVDWECSGIEFPNRFYKDSLFLKRTTYSAKEINTIDKYYKNEFLYIFRYLVVLWNMYVIKFFNIMNLMDFFATILRLVSPRLFNKVRVIWRAITFKPPLKK